MRKLLAGLTLAIVLSATPSLAMADEGDGDAAAANGDDPGITALRGAITELRASRAALRADCPNMGTPECRTSFQALRASFKEARMTAIAAHHAYRAEQKLARQAAAKEKADAGKARGADAKAQHKP